MSQGSVNTRRMCGERRCWHSMRIREILQRKGMSVADFARELGITRQMASKVITGASHSERVLDALRDAGVPEKYLFDPRRVDIKELGKVA